LKYSIEICYHYVHRPVTFAVLQDYQRLLSSNPSRRSNTSAVAACNFLKNQLVDVVAFMENIAGGWVGCEGVEEESFVV
jgi:hypothetical protein